MFKGSMVALVTPMAIDGSIDKKALHDLVEWHIASGTTAIIVAGTTGESATLTDAEKNELLIDVIHQVAGRIPVIAGTGTQSTESTIAQTLNAQHCGADACLIVTPFYNKPTQNGLYEHYKQIANRTTLPIIMYNVPGRTACDMLPETVGRLAMFPHIVGIKEATGNTQRVAEIISRCPESFKLYSGDDATCLEFMQKGGQGVISVTTNVAPQKMAEMCNAALSGDQARAEKINAELMPLHKKLFLESNPIPVKWALHEMGMIPSGIRLPLLPLDSKFHDEVRTALQASGVMQLA